MKRFGKLLSLFLAIVFTFSFAVGCNGSAGVPSAPGISGETTFTEKTDYTGGLHVGLDSKTPVQDKYILSPEGAVGYTLVLPNELDTRVTLAKNDFIEIFMKATGKNITSVLEGDVAVWDKNAKYISIGAEALELKAQEALTQAGETALAEKLTHDTRLGPNGYQIETIGDTIFIMAIDATGALFGTYELLTQLVNYQRYTTYFYETDKVTEIPLYNFSVIDNPDFERRLGPWGAVYSNVENASRMRWLNQYRDVFAVDSSIAPQHHNTLEYLPPEQHYETHPEWYAQKNVANPVQLETVYQLCYTAGVKKDDADKSKYEALVEAMADRVCQVLDKVRDKHIIQITQEDNSNFCTCEACREAIDHYGVIGGSMWEFTLRVNDRVQTWLEANQPDRQRVLVVSFAYQVYKHAPASKDANGVWTPKDLRDGTKMTQFPHFNTAGIYWSFGGDVAKSFINDPANKDQKDYIEGWQVCCNNFGWWGHQTNWDNYFLPVDSYGAMQENYKALAEGGAKYVFNQGQQGNENLTGFQNFKMYLNAKWEWNVNLDAEQLTQAYFNACYGPAKDVMYKFHMHQRMHLTLIGNVIGGVDSSVADDPARYPYATVMQWIRYCEEALDLIEPVKSENFELYEIYRKNILVESLCPRYMRIFWYEASLDPAQLVVEKRAFKEAVYFTGFSQWKQHEDVNDIMVGW